MLLVLHLHFLLVKHLHPEVFAGGQGRLGGADLDSCPSVRSWRNLPKSPKSEFHAPCLRLGVKF